MIYLDNAATTRVSQEVMNTISKFSLNDYANASSNHINGKANKKRVDKAREEVAKLINCKNSEIYFTSGATEGINTILRGYIEANIDNGKHIITSKTEHKAILETCTYLENIGIEVTYLDVDESGLINIDELTKTIREDTLLVAILMVNNETGVIQDIKSIGEVIYKTKSKLFVDATQAISKIDVDTKLLKIDMLCLSAHKFHGPKGVGAVYINNDLKVAPLIYGGGQEKSFRAGTYNVPGILGLAKACETSDTNLCDPKEVMDYFEMKILSKFDCFIVSKNTARSPYITNIIFNGIDAEIVIGMLKNTVISTGSACTSSIIEPSHVLSAMGFNNQQCFGSLRFSISKYTTKTDIDAAIIELEEVIR